jgi:RimJ/RimL family protein N-acetyltransferase
MLETSLNDMELAEIDLDALYTHDARGRIVRVNEPDGEPAPGMILVRTRAGNTWRVRHDVPDGVTRRLEELAAAEPVTDDLERPPVAWQELVEARGAIPGAESLHRDLSYRFPADLPEPAGVTRITRATIPLLHRMVGDVADVEPHFEQGEPCVAMVVDGAAVSLCYSCRLTDRAAEAGLETLEEYRGRGYAPAVVAAWARAVRDAGRIPFYSTSWDNTASQAVARKLGLVQYAVMFAIV